MQSTVSFQVLIQCAALIASMWGFFKIVNEIIKAITTRHDREQKWDEVANSMQKNIQEERDKIYDRYDSQLTDIRNELAENRDELFLLTKCMRGVLDGLHQLNCNGKVTEASEELDAYLNKRAHTA